MIGFLIPTITIGITLALSWLLGRYLQWAMDPEDPRPGRLRYERFSQYLLGGQSVSPQNWKQYCLSMLTFNLLMFIFVYVVLTTQQWLPLNPDGKESLDPGLAFNTAASFTSNTNLQHYSTSRPDVVTVCQRCDWPCCCHGAVSGAGWPA